jgi:hypothetical protein
VASTPPYGPLSDTSPAAEAFLIAGYRAMSPAAKLERVGALSEAIAQLAMSDIERRHPTASPRERLLRLASRRIDAETMRRAFGWDPGREGY